VDAGAESGLCFGAAVVAEDGCGCGGFAVAAAAEAAEAGSGSTVFAAAAATAVAAAASLLLWWFEFWLFALSRSSAAVHGTRAAWVPSCCPAEVCGCAACCGLDPVRTSNTSEMLDGGD